MNLNLLNVGFLGGMNVDTTYTSLYESFNPLTTLNKSHFVEWFSGAALRSIWTEWNISGTGTFSMNNSIDGGFQISTQSSVSNAHSGIGFNNIRHYSNTSSRFIAIIQQLDTSGFGNGTLNSGNGGFISSQRTDNPGTIAEAVIWEGVGGANYELITSDSFNNTSTSMGIAQDASYHLYDVTVGSSSVIALLDNANTTTNTTHLPNTAMQPIVGNQKNTSISLSSRTNVKYLEVYNI